MNSSIFHCFSKKDEMRVAAVAKWRLDCVAINYVGGEQKKPINTMIFVLVCDSIEFRVTILAVFLKIGFSVRHGLLFPYCAEEQFSIKKWGDGGGYVFTRNLTTYRNREKRWAQLSLRKKSYWAQRKCNKVHRHIFLSHPRPPIVLKSSELFQHHFYMSTLLIFKNFWGDLTSQSMLLLTNRRKAKWCHEDMGNISYHTHVWWGK